MNACARHSLSVYLSALVYLRVGSPEYVGYVCIDRDKHTLRVCAHQTHDTHKRTHKHAHAWPYRVRLCVSRPVFHGYESVLVYLACGTLPVARPRRCNMYAQSVGVWNELNQPAAEALPSVTDASWSSYFSVQIMKPILAWCLDSLDGNSW